MEKPVAQSPLTPPMIKISEITTENLGHAFPRDKDRESLLFATSTGGKSPAVGCADSIFLDLQRISAVGTASRKPQKIIARYTAAGRKSRGVFILRIARLPLQQHGLIAGETLVRLLVALSRLGYLGTRQGASAFGIQVCLNVVSRRQQTRALPRAVTKSRDAARCHCSNDGPLERVSPKNELPPGKNRMPHRREGWALWVEVDDAKH